MGEFAHYIRHIHETGRKVIGCFPLYPPLELLHSLGLVPITLWDLREAIPRVEKSNRHLQTFTCSVARRLVEFLLSEEGTDLDGLFMYNACDTLRNLPEIISSNLEEEGHPLRIFKLHLPMVPREQTDSHGYLSHRLERLIRELEETFHVHFSEEKFRQSVSLYGEMRRLCNELETHITNGYVSYEVYCRMLREGHFIPVEEQIMKLEKIMPSILASSRDNPAPNAQTRIIVSGISPPSAHMVATIENAGLLIGGNDIATQRRALNFTPSPVTDPAAYYQEFYDHHYPCPTLLYTADRREAALQELAARSGAAGTVFLGEKFCEYEYFEFPYMEKSMNNMGVHTLFLEVSIDDDEHIEAYVTRIEAFSEMLGTAKGRNDYAK